MSHHQRQFRLLIWLLGGLMIPIGLFNVLSPPDALGLPPSYLNNRIEGVGLKALVGGFGGRIWIPCSYYPDNPIQRIDYDPRLIPIAGSVRAKHGCNLPVTYRTVAPSISPEEYARLMADYPHRWSAEDTETPMLLFDVPVAPDVPVWLIGEAGWITLVPEHLLAQPITYESIPEPVYFNARLYVYLDGVNYVVYRVEPEVTLIRMFEIQPDDLQDAPVILTENEQGRAILMPQMNDTYRLVWMDAEGVILDNGFVFAGGAE